MVVDDNYTNNLICQFAIRKYKHEADVSLFIEPEVALQNITSDARHPAPSLFRLPTISQSRTFSSS